MVIFQKVSTKCTSTILLIPFFASGQVPENHQSTGLHCLYMRVFVSPLIATSCLSFYHGQFISHCVPLKVFICCVVLEGKNKIGSPDPTGMLLCLSRDYNDKNSSLPSVA